MTVKTRTIPRRDEFLHKRKIPVGTEPQPPHIAGPLYLSHRAT